MEALIVPFKNDIVKIIWDDDDNYCDDKSNNRILIANKLWLPTLHQPMGEGAISSIKLRYMFMNLSQEINLLI
jgi:hypothetical protein